MPRLSEKQFFQEHLTATPPEGVNLHVGQLVTMTNPQGVKFHNMRILGFAKSPEYGRLVHFEGAGSPYWYGYPLEAITP
jgi:hypothetical protein